MTTFSFRGLTRAVSVELVTESCYLCGVVFAITTDFRKERLRDLRAFYCPSGHGQAYMENVTEKKLRQAEERLKAEKGWSSRLSDALEAEKKQHSSTKGQLTKTRNRIQSGHCPECHQFFGQLKRHMEAEHPAVPA